MTRRQRLTGQAADGQADENHVRKTQIPDQPGGIIGQLIDAVGARGFLRQPVTALVKAHDPQTRRQQRQHVVPDPEIGSQRSGKDNRRAILGALIGIMQIGPVHMRCQHQYGNPT